MGKLNKIAGIMFPVFLVLIASYIAFKNYSFGTSLIGWDSLHPEFNFSLNFFRSFFGVWREEQGLGVLSAHSHMADLPRIFILWISSFLVQKELLRYLYIFLCLILGPLGMYFFLGEIFKGRLNVKVTSLLGGLFYLLNLITLQHSFVLFEMFLVCFAFFPWLFFFVLRFIENGEKKNLLLFSLFTLLSSPMAYAATLFYVYLISLFIFVFFYSILKKKWFLSLKRGFVLVLITVLLNLYWIAPNIYSVINQSDTISESKINTLFSPEAFLRNSEYGDAKNITTFKNFLFEWRIFDFKEGKYVDLFESWNSYLSDKWFIGYIFSGISFLGLIISLIKRNRIGISFLPLTLISLFFLVNINPPTGEFYRYLYNNFPLLREGFRMPFTKFSLVYLFAFTVYLGLFFDFLFLLFSKLKIFGKLLSAIFVIGFVGVLVYFNKPIFEGELISSQIKTKLPQEYYQLFDYFNDKKGRIAKLPMQTLWGWQYHDWKYEGSGFIPFGIKSPTLDRDFDRWSSFNESFYNQASYYLYSKNLGSFEKTLEKFDVKYLLLDESIINAGGDSKILFTSEIKEMILGSKKIKEVQKFGFLTIYETSFGIQDKYISSPQSYIRLNVDQNYSQIDPIYEKYSTYVFDKEGISYPFVNFDKRGSLEIFEDKDFLNFKNGDIKAMFPLEEKITEDFSLNRGFKEAYNCDLKKIGEVWKEIKYDGVWYKALGSGVSCDFFDYSNLSYDQGYALRIKGKNLNGRSLKIYLYNKKTTRMDLEELLPNGEFDEYFVILPKSETKEKDDKGYTLNLETRSFGKVASENIIELIEFIPIDINFLTSLVTEPESVEIITNNLNVTNTYKFGTSNYVVDYENQGLLVLGQGYDQGWNAFMLSGNHDGMIAKYLPFIYSKPLEHVKVNSWANGWIVPEGSGTVSIVFWPQYLEWGGMILGGLTILFIIFIMISEKCKNVYFTETNTSKRRTSKKGN